MTATRRPATLIAVFIAALASLALVASACGDDKASDKSTTTTTAKKSSTTTSAKSSTDGTDSTDTTVAAADFDTAVTKANESLKSAKGPCDVVNALEAISNVSNPTTQAQVKAASEFYVLLANTMASTTDDSAEAAKLKAGADAFEKYAKSVDYDPAKMDLSGEGPQFAEAKSMQDAMSSFMQTQMTSCAQTGDTGASTTVAP